MTFDPGLFQAERKGAWGADLRWHERLGSTQDAAEAARLGGAATGCVVLAEAQDTGRGRWGKRWESRPGQSLLFTALVPAAEPAAQLPLVLGLASARALRSLGIADAGCKWPNDLWWRGRKLGGLLVERRGDAILAGCGVNVAQVPGDFPPELRNSAASLAQAGVRAPRERLLAALLASWEEAWRLWQAHGWEALAGEWAAYDALAGQRCRLTRAGQAYEGVVLGLAPDGALRLSLGPGKHMDFHSAEVEHLRPAEAGPGH